MNLWEIRWIIFAALVVAAPCPFLMFAAGGVVPLPVIAAFAFDPFPAVVLLALLHVAAYAALFLWFSRTAAQRIHSLPTGWHSLAVAGVLLAFLLLGLMPIYGGGENLGAGGGYFENLYATYRDELFRPYLHAWRTGAWRVR